MLRVSIFTDSLHLFSLISILFFKIYFYFWNPLHFVQMTNKVLLIDWLLANVLLIILTNDMRCEVQEMMMKWYYYITPTNYSRSTAVHTVVIVLYHSVYYWMSAIVLLF